MRQLGIQLRQRDRPLRATSTRSISDHPLTPRRVKQLEFQNVAVRQSVGSYLFTTLAP